MIGIKKIKFYIFLALMIISFALFLVFIFTGYDSQHFLMTLESYGVPELLYTAWIILAVATTLPISAVIFAGIVYFTFFKAMIYAFIGILLGAVITFYLSRWLGRDYIKSEYNTKGKGKLAAINRIIQKNSVAYVVVLAFVYIFPTNLAYMIAGVTDMTLGQVVLITVLGNITTTLGVGAISLGILGSNITYIIGGAAILAIINIVPILIYYKQMKELIRVL